MGYAMGIDIGTSSTKAVLFDAVGRQVARGTRQYSLRTPEPEAAEQSADDILQAVAAAVAAAIAASGIDPKQVIGIAFSAAMHTLLLVDECGQPLTPMYTWADNRSNCWVPYANEADGALYARTGVPVHPMSPLVKLVWLRHEQPAVFAQAARAVSIKEYVLYRWCGDWVVDFSIAAATGLLHLRTLDWDASALKIAGLEPGQLSRLVPVTHRLPDPEIELTQQMGLAAGTPVIVGASDGVLANVGVGAIAPGTAAITLGTSGAVRRVVASPTTEPTAQLFCYAMGDRQWVMGGAVNTGGIALQWLRDRLLSAGDVSDLPDGGERLTYEQLTDMAGAIAPGADGLIFHPYLLGERAPLWDARARASFFGLGFQHTQAHLVRAVLEGVLYNLHSVFQALEQAGGPIETLRASGGFARSSLWRQMLADIFDRPVLIPAAIESSAFGAAGLAMVAMGEWASLAAIGERVEITCTQQPVADNVRQYQKLLPIYADLLAGFREQYAALQQAIARE